MSSQRNYKQFLPKKTRFLDEKMSIVNYNNREQSSSNVVLSVHSLQEYRRKNQIQISDYQQQEEIQERAVSPSHQMQQSHKITVIQTFKNVEKPQKKHFQLTKNLINHLYRQNIKNYNPYMATLSLLQEQQELKWMQKQKIRSLCYIGIAKTYIKSKKYSAAPNYTPVNVLIRTYMRDQMCKEIIDKEESNQNVIYIPINELALSFNPLKFPNNLEDVMAKPLYTEVVNEVNKIISSEYIEYKKINTYENDESLMGKIILGIILFFCLIFFIKQTKQLLFVMFALGLIWIIYVIYIGKIKLQKMVQSKNVTRTIEQKLVAYFNNIKTYRMEWKVGQDFYWLQIHYIKMKKKDFKG